MRNTAGGKLPVIVDSNVPSLTCNTRDSNSGRRGRTQMTGRQHLPVIVDIGDGEPVPGGVGHLPQGIAQVLDGSVLWTGHLMPYKKYIVKYSLSLKQN
jgi:hypothetical protein